MCIHTPLIHTIHPGIAAIVYVHSALGQACQFLCVAFTQLHMFNSAKLQYIWHTTVSTTAVQEAIILQAAMSGRYCKIAGVLEFFLTKRVGFLYESQGRALPTVSTWQLQPYGDGNQIQIPTACVFNIRQNNTELPTSTPLPFTT